MNAPYSFNFKYDPILENPFRSEIDYNLVSVDIFVSALLLFLLKKYY